MLVPAVLYPCGQLPPLHLTVPAIAVLWDWVHELPPHPMSPLVAVL